MPVTPRTYVGRWLLATMLFNSSERQRLSRLLNGGKSGWNYDEPAVVEVAFQTVVNRIFSSSADVREVTAFVQNLRSRMHGPEVPDQLESEALIRAALGDPDVVIRGIEFSNILSIHTLVLISAAQRLGMSESEITQLVVDSERIAFERGWKPPLAT